MHLDLVNTWYHYDLFPHSYNSEMDKVICFIRIPMDKIEKISIGKQWNVLIKATQLIGSRTGGGGEGGHLPLPKSKHSYI